MTKEETSFKFSNGVIVESAAIVHNKNCGEDDNITATNVADALKNLPSLISGVPSLDERFTEERLSKIAEEFELKFGEVALFGVFDGHGLRPWQFKAASLPIFAETAVKMSQEGVKIRKLLTKTAEIFPKYLHDYWRTANPTNLDEGTTFSFTILTSKLCIQGIVGDSPVGVVTKEGVCSSLACHDNHMAKENKSLKWGNVHTLSFRYVSYSFCQYKLMMHNSLGDVIFDQDVQESLEECYFCTDEEEKKGLEQALGPYQSAFKKAWFIPKTKAESYERSPRIFDRMADVMVYKIKDLQAAIICSDGYREKLPTDFCKDLNWKKESIEKVMEKLLKERDEDIYDDLTVLAIRFN